MFGFSSNPGSVQVGEAKPGEGAPRRSFTDPSKLVEGKDLEIHTVWDIVQRCAAKFPTKNGFGYRDLIKEHTEEKMVKKMIKGKEIEEKKKWTFYEMSDYKYITFGQIKDQVQAVGSGLRELGIEKGKTFNVYAATAPNWQLMACGCASQSITFATAYDSLGEEGVRVLIRFSGAVHADAVIITPYVSILINGDNPGVLSPVIHLKQLAHSLNEPEVVGMFTNANLLGTLAKVVSQTPTVKLVVYDGQADQALLKKIESANDGVKTIHIDELKKLGAEKNHAPTPPTGDDICCIMYTSGSTGAPKGVLLTHRNVCASVAAVHMLLIHLLTEDMTYIAYLPLAHILEFVVELIMMYHAIPCGYGSVKTLTAASMRNCLGDMQAFKPTIMVGVPAVWEQIRKGILTKVKEGGKERLFNIAMSMKRSSSILGAVADAVVFKKVKEATGGRLKFALSGGAAISRETQAFLQTALVTMLSGYGMTESSAMCLILPPEYLVSGHKYGGAGVPVPCTEIKLLDEPELGYSSKNDPPTGEICVRGPSITKGYFKRPDLANETFTADGYLRTGDIGQWNPDGTLSIIDRKKNLVKLAGGEYIAIERLETTYGSCNLVQKVCLHADPNASKPMAIVFPNEKNLRAACSSHGFADNEDLKTLCEDEKVRDLVTAELNAVGKKQGFKGLEMVQATVLDPEEWTPHNGMLTAAQKLQRKAIVSKHQDDIKKVYP